MRAFRFSGTVFMGTTCERGCSLPCAIYLLQLVTAWLQCNREQNLMSYMNSRMSDRTTANHCHCCQFFRVASGNRNDSYLLLRIMYIM